MRNNAKDKSIAVIFAGGQGSRLWPISTESLPKQLNPLFSKKTLVKEVFERVEKIFPKERIVVVTTKNLERKIKKIIKIPEKNFIIQPRNADTGAAMCFTAFYLETLFPESIAILFYSDHKIVGMKSFKKSIEDLVGMAERFSSLITIGTKPTMPSTQFGYIKIGNKKENDLYEVAEFKEKPDYEKAKKYLEDGKYFWNTGVYAWKTSILLATLKKTSPRYYEDLINLKVVQGGKDFKKKVKAWFEKITPEPFEKIVSEKTSDMLVYTAKYSWSDIGNWVTVYGLSPKDSKKNVILEKNKDQKISLLDTSGSMVLSKSKKTVLLGVKNVIVIQSGDSLLVCKRNKIDKIKESLKDLS